jgi:hypothetical protein
MVADTAPRTLDEVERGVEDALNNFAGRKPQPSEPPKLTAAERIEKIGTVAARAITETCESAANDIEQAGHFAVEIAADIMREAEQLAEGLRANGKQISEHLHEFAMLARKVSTTMRDTRAEVLNPAAEKHITQTTVSPPIAEDEHTPSR